MGNALFKAGVRCVLGVKMHGVDIPAGCAEQGDLPISDGFTEAALAADLELIVGIGCEFTHIGIVMLIDKIRPAPPVGFSALATLS